MVICGRFLIPSEQAASLIHHVHCIKNLTKHLGFPKTYKHLNQHYYWPTLGQDVHNFIDECTVGARSKFYRSVKQSPFPITVESRRFSHSSIDLYGSNSLPNSNASKGVFVIMDDLNSYVRFAPLKSMSGHAVLETLIDH